MVAPARIDDERFDIGIYLLLLILCFATYYRLSDNAFYKDDYLWMLAGRYDITPAGAFTFRLVGFFRPVTNLAFWLTEHIRPGSGAFYNNTNLLLHYTNAVLCFHLLRSLFGERFVPAVGTILFAVYYAHSGAVLWVSARTTLLMTAFLLSSLLVAVGGKGSTRRSVAAVILYVLALGTKETAIAGVGLVVLLYLGWRDRVGGAVVGGYVVAAAAYVAVRTALLGGIVQENWGPGPEAVVNVLGGLLYLFYPHDITHILGSSWALRAAPHPFWPELGAVFVAAALVLLAHAAHRRREMRFALAWTVVALVPASCFHFRFLAVRSNVQNRYDYLAGVGAALALALLLSALWRAARGRTPLRVAVAAVVAVLVAANIQAVQRVEAYWGNSNQRFQELVEDVASHVDEHPDETTVAIRGLDGWQPFFARAVQYRRPSRTVVYIHSENELAEYAPCLYVDIDRRADGAVTYRLREVEASSGD